MDLFRKAFLLFVGAISLVLEETTKSVKDAGQSIEEYREKLVERAKPA